MNPILSKVLNSIKPGFANIYAKRPLTTTSDNLVKYNFWPIDREEAIALSQGLFKKLYIPSSKLGRNPLNLEDAQTVFQTASYDIEIMEEDRFGKIMVISSDGMKLHYGNRGIIPSAKLSPRNLLNYQLEIPAHSQGVLNIRHHTPFLLESFNTKDSFALPFAQTFQINEFDEKRIIKKGLIRIDIPLGEDLAEKLRKTIKERIFNDPKKENFFEETTLMISKPNHYTQSSSTLMNFQEKTSGNSGTTNSHYHPGDRTLVIFNADESAGVTLNFCGIAENPDNRKDCESFLKFPNNSMFILDFPAYTHHKFHGQFACISSHPKDGPNIINTLESGNLSTGFLENATIFSETHEDQKKWHLSTPDAPSTKNNATRER